MKGKLNLLALMVALTTGLSAAPSYGCESTHCSPQNSGGFSVGERVYVVSAPRENTTARIVGIETNGHFLLKFDSDGAVGNGWVASDLAKTSGCKNRFCVNESVYVIDEPRENTLGKIVGIQYDGSFVLRFESDGAVGHNWAQNQLARRSGCSSDVCVGQRVYVVGPPRENTTAVIVGIQSDGRFVLRFETDGAVGHNWDRDDLVCRQDSDYVLDYLK
jgi:biotin-(acetyl-CoA carboxylase) ligase